jgi:hypothetical protein
MMVPLSERTRQTISGNQVVHSATAEKIKTIHVVPVAQMQSCDVLEFGSMALGIMGSLLLAAYLATSDWYSSIRALCSMIMGTQG